MDVSLYKCRRKKPPKKLFYVNKSYFISLKTYLDTNQGNEIGSCFGIESKFIHSFVRHLLISSYMQGHQLALEISSKHFTSYKCQGQRKELFCEFQQRQEEQPIC